MPASRTVHRTLPDHPDLDQLRRQAKELLEAFRSGDAAARADFDAHFPGAPAAVALSHAQLVLARAYGFDSWPKLKSYVDGVTVARLITAVRTGDVDRVRRMLKARPELVDMDAAEYDEHRALHHAVLARLPEMVRLLMTNGADPRKGIYPHRDATTPVALAADRGYDEILEILLEEERRRRPEHMRDVPLPVSGTLPPWTASLEGPDGEDHALEMLEAHPELAHAAFPTDGITALHAAASKGWARVVHRLLERGANPNARAKWGATPLEAAGFSLRSGERTNAVIDLLLEHGAVRTPRWAVATRNADWLRARHREGVLENVISEIGGLLRAAVVHDRPDMLALLLDLGFDPDERVRAGGTEWSGMPLQECLRTGRLEMAQMLVDRGARVTADVAVALGMVDWLRERHAEGALAGSAGLLTLAVKFERADVLTLLLELGFDPDERHRVDGVEEPVFSWGEPLRECAGPGRLRLAEMLLEHGADPNTRVYAASSVMLEAYQRDDQPLIALLRRHGGILAASEAGFLGLEQEAARLLADEASGVLHEGAVWPGTTVAEQLLWSGADGGHSHIVRLALAHLAWERDDPRWHSMLRRVLGSHDAADRGRFLDCFRMMLQRCDASVRGGAYRSTMLHDLSGSWCPPSPDERLAMAELLLDAGARLDVRDDVLMSTPLGWACRWGRIEMVRLLLERGADPVEPGSEPWAAPIAWAEKTGRTAIVALLRDHAR